MPIAERKPTVDKPPIQNKPAIQPKEYSSVVVDGNTTKLTSLIAYAEGAPWTVDYYQQVNSKNNDVRDFDPGQDNVYQQYNKINKLEIRVTTPLNSSQDTETTLVHVTGAANIHSNIIPNVGDIFIANALNGRPGLFNINNVERKALDRESVYFVDYELVCFVDRDPQRIQNLESKVIRQYFFDKERLVEGLKPMLQEAEYKEAKDLSYSYKAICDYYFTTFFNREFSTLIIPGQESIIYDPFLVDFILRIVDTFDNDTIRYVKNMGSEFDPFMMEDQFWTMMMQRNHAGLSFTNMKMGLALARSFQNKAEISTYKYSRIEYVTYPKIVDTSFMSGRSVLTSKPTDYSSVIEAMSESTSISNLIYNQYIEQNTTIPLIKPVLCDDYYVLSQEFYEDKAPQSVLEIVTTQYLKGEAISVQKLTKLCSTFQRWGRLEQFYYIPILLTVMKAARQNLY